jgi:dienelactone hydrolase
MSWDKPGSGKSVGVYDRDDLIEERAAVVNKAMNLLKGRDDIDPSKIGLWGISQAGWVMPLVISRRDDVAFMIAISCTGMSGIRQSASLIRRNLILEGLPEREAEMFSQHYLKRSRAITYEEYLKHAEPLSRQPFITENLGWGGIATKDEFSPMPDDHWVFLEAEPLIEKIRCPVLAIFGEKDTQGPVEQGVEAYRRALTKAGNNRYKIIVFPGADHILMKSETGGIREQEEKDEIGESDFVQGFFDVMEEWVGNLYE